MTRHVTTPEDERFARAFEAFEISPTEFDHTAHVRLAYVYLCADRPAAATVAMKRSLLAFLDHLAVGTAKYHETMTRAWIEAVAHFMDSTPACAGFAEFIARNPVLLDSKVMLLHYSAEVLFSDEARAGFVEPDLAPIPRPGD